jgi:hypothetical protein
MQLGLVTLATTLENFVERIVVFFCFFWARRVLTKLIPQNLVAHRARNRKTSVMYAFSTITSTSILHYFVVFVLI